MLRKISFLLLTLVFFVGLAILVAGWMYSGDILPERTSEWASSYDKAGFYVAVGIWVGTWASGITLAIMLFIRVSSLKNIK
jgi:hypothetical protein